MSTNEFNSIKKTNHIICNMYSLVCKIHISSVDNSNSCSGGFVKSILKNAFFKIFSCLNRNKNTDLRLSSFMHERLNESRYSEAYTDLQQYVERGGTLWGISVWTDFDCVDTDRCWITNERLGRKTPASTCLIGCSRKLVFKRWSE